MSERVLNVCLVVATAVVAALGIQRLAAGLPGQSATPSLGPAISHERGWRTYTDAGHNLGPPGAPVTLVVFTDFQCPYCGQLARSLPALQQAFPKDLEIRIRHFPLEVTHPFARRVALGAICADQQGRFQAYHDLAFAVQDSLSVLDVATLAARVAVSDLARFTSCVEAPATQAHLDADLAAGRRLQIRGTPTLLINDTKVSGTLPLSVLDSLVRAKRTAPKT